MKIYDCVQGTTEWRRARLALPSASQFHRIITPKGEPSKSQDMYLFELLAERITGEPGDPFSSHWMLRGTEMESDAVTYYEFQNDCKTEPIGYIINDEHTYGASPDRSVDEDGLLEIKCPKPAVHIGYLVQSGEAYKEHRIQAQGQLLVTGRAWVDLLSYCPGLPYAVHRANREEKYLELMKTRLDEFCQRLAALQLKLAKDGIISGASAGADGDSIRGSSQAPDNLVDKLKESLIAIQK